MKDTKLLAVLLSVLLVGLTACSPPQYIYSDTLVVDEVIELSNDKRGKYKYHCNDADGRITFWSNQAFKRGDTLTITLSN